jgi:hypothetical protein
VADEFFYCDCFLCKRSFKIGPHLYEGKRIPSWNIMICDTCRDSNWDGIVPNSHKDLVEYLEVQGIEIHLNEKGWINIPK